MEVYSPNGIKIYELNPTKNLPEWLDEKRKKRLTKKYLEKSQDIELIQDFEMPDATSCIAMSRDEEHIFATGTYKPRVRCFDVYQKSMKFERCMDSEVLKFKILEDDYKKLVFLQQDRYVEFHAQFGKLTRTRIPFFGRDLAYMKGPAELYFVGVGSEVFRLSLSLGRAMKPLQLSAKDWNCCDVNREIEFFACGSSQGTVEYWESRTPKCFQKYHIAEQSGLDFNILPGSEVTCMSFCDAYTLGVGTSKGQTLIYDVRSNKPVAVRDQGYKEPIRSLAFTRNAYNEKLCLSANKKILKLWNRDNGKPYTYFNPEPGINDFLLVPNTGLIFTTNCRQKILSYYIPDLGPPPKWLTEMSQLTEEFENQEHVQNTYLSFRFVTTEELEKLNLSHLIGTNNLRAEMHGYLIKTALYDMAKKEAGILEKQIAPPLANPKPRIEKAEQQLKLPKVNRKLAEKLHMDKSKGNKAAQSLLSNPMFSELFTNKDFEIDEQSENYVRFANAIRKNKLNKKKEVPGGGGDDDDVTDDEEKVKDDDDDDSEAKSQSESDNTSGSEEEEEEEEVGHMEASKKQADTTENPKKRKRQPSLNPWAPSSKRSKVEELKVEVGNVMGKSNKNQLKESERMSKMSFGKRLEMTGNIQVSSTTSSYGNMEAKFEIGQKQNTRWKERQAEHKAERRKVARPASNLKRRTKRE